MAFKADIIPPTGTYEYSLGDPVNSKNWDVNGHNSGYIELVVSLQSADGETLVINDSRITENHVVLGNLSSDLIGYKYVPI